MVNSKMVGKWMIFVRTPIIPSKGDIDLLGTVWEVQHVFQNRDKHIMLHIQNYNGEVMEQRIYSGKQMFQIFDHWDEVVQWRNDHKIQVEIWKEMQDVE